MSGSGGERESAAVPGQGPRLAVLAAGPCRGQTAWRSSPKWGCPAVRLTHAHTHSGCGCEEAAPPRAGSPADPCWGGGGVAQAGPGSERSGRVVAGTPGAGSARSGRNSRRKLCSDPLLDPPRFCRPGPSALPLKLASPVIMPCVSSSGLPH